MRTPGFLSVWLLLTLLAAPAAGQVRIVGRVIANDTEAPITNAQITARSRTGRFLRVTTTDAKGNFELLIQRVGAVEIRANHDSYQANTAPTLYFGDHTFFRVEIRLDREVVLLAPLEVVGRSVDPSPFLDEFRQRVRTGLGIYITRAEIDRRRPMYVTDMLREIPGIQLQTTGSGGRPIVQMARAAGRSCSTRIFVDGMLLNPTMMTPRGPRADVFRIDDIVSPGSVEGIEIYRGLSTVPPEFLGGDAQCGVIAIWTRRGGR